MPAPMSIDAFMAKVTKTDGCWLWQGSRTRSGYGQVGAGRRTVRAHRLAYELLVGPIPTGKQLDHLCRVRHCVNPAHLEPVVSRTNTLRSPVAAAAVNAAKTHCVHGHPFDEANTGTDGRRRWCRTCLRDKVAKRRAGKAAA